MRNRKYVIYDTKEVIDLIYTHDVLKTNISYLKSKNKLCCLDYFQEYDFRLKDVEQSFKDGRKNIKYYKYEIAFKFTKNEKYLKKLVNDVIKYITGDSFVLEYVAFVNKRKSCVTIVLFDRYFYPDSKVVDVIVKNDWKNGKYKAGDVKGKKTIYVTEKLRYFNFKSKALLAKYFETMRLYLMDNKSDNNENDNDKGIVSDKKLKVSKDRYVRVKRKEIFYSQIGEYRMRKIRAINSLIRLNNLNVVNITEDVIKRYKQRINTPYDVSKYENEILDLMYN
ncbi:hypothetical protein R2F61_01925 [Mollicutes bacterium LVI A0078]|nr:hypothetical protein RZE84_01935 [Mollicutes bacterium LVI A0075]WOO90508.1 hypothetical protein R2F61_07195 [Mollicutes bacterium LVI A0078]WOO91334.1 hypothetical protein R2F61_01925 [Mollicutes bacterium LVI A0078]